MENMKNEIETLENKILQFRYMISQEVGATDSHKANMFIKEYFILNEQYLRLKNPEMELYES